MNARPSSGSTAGRAGRAAVRGSRIDAIDGDSISSSGLGVETDQSEPAIVHRARRRSDLNGYCQVPRSCRGRGGQLVHLVSWQPTSGWALPRRPAPAKRGMSLGWMTWMWLMWCRPPESPFASGRFDGVERLAHRPVADRVEVDLEVRRIESADVTRSASGSPRRCPVARRARRPATGRLEHRAGERLEDAVHHDLHLVLW